MNCEILKTIYVRSNGDIPCNCDTGEQVILGNISTENPLWDIQEIFENESYTNIRKDLSSGQIPWGDICTKCAFFRRDEPFSESLPHRKLRKIHLEPTLACNLECPGCSNSTQIKTRPKPHLMKIEMLETLFRSLSKNSYSVEEILYSGQGDPLMHPKFSEFVKIIREYCPTTRQTLCTNGNFDYWKTTQGRFIDTIYVSCDGVFQENYEKYRVRGEVNKPIQFMKEVAKAGSKGKQQLIWKYILFEFNDSEEELIAAQKLANSIGVDTLLFVFTHSKYKSFQYPPERVSNLPIIYPNVTTNLTPHFSNKDLKLKGFSSNSREKLLPIRPLVNRVLKKFYG